MSALRGTLVDVASAVRGLPVRDEASVSWVRSVGRLVGYGSAAVGMVWMHPALLLILAGLVLAALLEDR